MSERVSDLIEAMKPFLDLRHQRGSWGVISKKLEDMAPITITVTKGQMNAALQAFARATAQQDSGREG